MPRPGPRPYECIRRAWHIDSHQPLRGMLIHEIFRLVNELHGASTRRKKEWQEKLPIVVLRAEEILYSKANSENEYRDVDTLRSRLDDAVNTMIRREDGEEEGLYLLPCVEAALSLGCTLKRTSRSHRKGTSRHLCNPTRAVVAGVRTAGGDCNTGMAFMDSLCSSHDMRADAAFGLMTQAALIQDQSPSSFIGRIGAFWGPYPCHLLDTAHSIMAQNTPIRNVINAHCPVGTSPHPKPGDLVQFLRDPDAGHFVGNMPPDVTPLGAIQRPCGAPQELRDQQLLDADETLRRRMDSRVLPGQPILCPSGYGPLLTTRFAGDNCGIDGPFIGSSGFDTTPHDPLVAVLPKNDFFLEKQRCIHAEFSPAQVDMSSATFLSQKNISLLPSWCKSNTASNVDMDASAIPSATKTSTADHDLQLRLGLPATEPSVPPVKRMRVDALNQSATQM